MATKSFSRDIIMKNSSAVKFLKSSLEKNSFQSEWRVAPQTKGSKCISVSQVKSILKKY
ncbi:MAG: hypothetical protein WBI82_10375 [Sphaerochaeta sp.]